jgi:hypothetical protein
LWFSSFGLVLIVFAARWLLAFFPVFLALLVFFGVLWVVLAVRVEKLHTAGRN